MTFIDLNGKSGIMISNIESIASTVLGHINRDGKNYKEIG
jgi:hypothetical protein